MAVARLVGRSAEAIAKWRRGLAKASSHLGRWPIERMVPLVLGGGDRRAALLGDGCDARLQLPDGG